MDDSGAFLAWAAQAIARRWPRARVEEIAALRGDLSSRRFWRVAIATRGEAAAPPTAILVDLGPDDLPRYVRVLNLLATPISEPPWLNVHRFLASIGAPVPALYDADPARRAILVEDVGTISLLDAVRSPGADTADLFRLATTELLRLHVDGTARIDSRCIAREIAYTGRLFEWELKEFAEVGLAAVAPGADFSPIASELTRLAARLDRFPRVFSHRDYHRENLFIQDGPRIRIIDFQDALMAPAAQDLAVLLTTRDTGEVITLNIERRILDFYCAGLVRRGAHALDAAEFMTSYHLCVLQHALKMIGRFEMFERSGKTGYRPYIPHVLAEARRMLAEMRADFPKLSAALMP
ncbi:MAG TPA: phosphotransferase [Candidatus Binatus sp.]|uniref:phosphotransferase n=1 Tax=Candidatus Binatus sp. TaxID=2811406 RepID=UPI002B47E17A|nr:phosphotransferase [Candidatus Binatus sp.]HKN14133.1 phosphotransferase [Candidatus Binatus sp.]